MGSIHRKYIGLGDTRVHAATEGIGEANHYIGYFLNFGHIIVGEAVEVGNGFVVFVGDVVDAKVVGHFFAQIVTGGVHAHLVNELLIAWFVTGFAVDEKESVFDFEGIAGESHTTFDIVFFFIYGAVVLFVLRPIEHHIVVSFNLGEPPDAFIGPFYRFGIRFAAKNGHGMMNEGDSERRHGESGPVVHFANEEVIVNEK